MPSMIRLLVFGLAFPSFGCDDPPAPSTPTVETEEAPELEPTPEPEPVVPSGRIRDGLGSDNVTIIEGGDRVLIGRMEVTAVLQAEERWLLHEDQIAGHPLTQPLREVDLDATGNATLMASLLDDSRYDFRTQRRCRNDYYIGLRFVRGEDVVEFALGMDCEQAYFVYRSGEETLSVGALLNSEDCGRLVAASVPLP